MTSKRRKSRKSELPEVHRNAAGLDVGSTFHVVAVPQDLDEMPVRTFGSFTGDLRDMASWLKNIGITTIAMESTGVYWIPVFEILEAHGFEVVLANARHVKNVPGRKTDVSDARWIQKLHTHGLLSASFRPRDQIAALRSYLRHRERLVEYCAGHIQHMQKAMMQMNVQLHHVVSDITGLTGMRIIQDILGGTTDPAVLAQHRNARCKSSEQTICKALDGNYRPEHLFALGQAHGLYQTYQGLIEECDKEIEAALQVLNAERTSPSHPPSPTSREVTPTRGAIL